MRDEREDVRLTRTLSYPQETRTPSRSEISWRWVALAPIAFVLALSLTAACSHTMPYYGRGIEALTAQRPDDRVTYRILLIGDAGDPDEPVEPVRMSLQRWTQRAPERTLVVFLGDNVYPEGMTPSNQQDARQRLVRQLAVVRNNEATALVCARESRLGQGKSRWT